MQNSAFNTIYNIIYTIAIAQCLVLLHFDFKVKHHKKEQRRKQREIRKQQRKETRLDVDESSQMSSGEVRMHVRETSTGKIIRGEEAPLASELEAWLEKNPGYEEAPRDEDADSSDSDEEKVDPENTEDVIGKAKKVSKLVLIIFSCLC